MPSIRQFSIRPQGRPCYPTVAAEDASSVPFNHRSNNARGRQRPRICLHLIALPPRILNTKDSVILGLGVTRSTRIELRPVLIAGRRLWFSLPKHRPSISWKYHLRSCGCFCQLMNFCFLNEENITAPATLFTPKLPFPKHTQDSWVSLQEVNASA